MTRIHASVPLDLTAATRSLHHPGGEDTDRTGMVASAEDLRCSISASSAVAMSLSLGSSTDGKVQHDARVCAESTSTPALRSVRDDRDNTASHFEVNNNDTLSINISRLVLDKRPCSEADDGEFLDTASLIVEVDASETPANLNFAAIADDSTLKSSKLQIPPTQSHDVFSNSCLLAHIGAQFDPLSKPEHFENFLNGLYTVGYDLTRRERLTNVIRHLVEVGLDAEAVCHNDAPTP